MTTKKRTLLTVAAVAAALLVTGAVFYLQLPALNIYSNEFWGFLTFAIAIIAPEA